MKVTDYIQNDKNCCCIYGIRENETGKTLYVGKTKNLHNRIQTHWYSQNTEIERWMREHREMYSYYIIEECNKDELTNREQFYIKKLGTDTDGLNHLIIYKTEEEKQESRLRYRKEHREELKNRTKQYREQNPDYLKKYYQKNKQRIMEYNKRYCKEHPEVRKAIEERRKEKRKEYVKQYYATHKEQRKKWVENHKEQIKEYHKEYYRNNKVQD